MSKVYISPCACIGLADFLREKGHELITVSHRGEVYAAVCTHPDMFMCRMGAAPGNELIMARPGDVGYSYPENIGFNAVCLDRYLVHNLKCTSPAVREAAERAGLLPVNVRQGYTKCSTVVVDGRSVITADRGISETLSALGDVDVLTVRGGYVKLPGLNEGFLGGASGRVGVEIVFNGDLTLHPDFEHIAEFITSRGLTVRYFPGCELTDIGSVIEV